MADATNRIDQTAVYIRLIDKGTSVLMTAIYGATAVGLAYYASQSIGYLAGQQTDIFISYLSETASGITITVSVSIGVLGTIYGWWQRALHQRAVKHFAPQLAHYQRQIDPQRSSSGLLPNGSTNPDDL